MTLLAPWALWFAAIGLGVVALYVLKIKRRAQTVPALDFWLELAGRTKVHSLWERLKRLFSMLLWLAIVACLVMALGNPILSMGRIKPRSIAVILDNSASMQAVEADGRTRLEHAREALQKLTSSRPVTDRWLLIESAATPRVLQPWTIEGKAVRNAAESLEPFNGSNDTAAAMELARQLLADKPEPTIVLISDAGIGSETAPAPAAGAAVQAASPSEQVIHWPIGATRDNLGIARLAVRAHRQQGNYHALVGIVNASDAVQETQLSLSLDGSTHSVELVKVEPGAVWERTLVIDAPGGGILRANIERPDALALDNEAYAVLEPVRPAVVWLVSDAEQAFFFEQALASMDPLVAAEDSLTLSPADYEAALSALERAEPGLKRPDVVVFNNAAPARLPPRGRLVFVNAWPREIPAEIRGNVSSPQLFLSPRKHPLTQHVTLQGVRLARAHAVALSGAAKVLAHSPDGDPLMFLVERPDLEALCIAFDVLESDMPFRNAFPLLLRNAVAHFQVSGSSILNPEYRIGEIIEPLRPLPSQATQVSIQTVGQEKAETLPIQSGRFRFPALRQPGAIRCTIDGQTVSAAVNLADARESRLAPMESEDPSKQLGLSRRLLGALPWVALATVAGILITLEWLTYHHRWTE